MYFIGLSILFYFLPLILILIINKKGLNIYSLLIYTMSGIFLFSIILNYFFVIKFKGNANILIFPDEFTYLYKKYDLGLFDEFVKIIFSIGGIALVRAVNIFSFSLGLLMTLKEIVLVSKKLKEVFIITIVAFSLIFFGYWSFFVLKESLTFLGLTLYLFSQNNDRKRSSIMKTISFLILLISRPNLLLLIIATDFLFFLYNKFGRKIAILMLFLALAIVILYMNSPASYPTKLSIIARRFGEDNPIFDETTKSIASQNFISFILSKEYHQTILTNINSTLNFLYNSKSPIISIIRFFNLMGLIIITFYLKFPTKKIKFLFFSLTLLLFMTHSVLRYFNVIVVPFLSYSYSYHSSHFNNSKTRGKLYSEIIYNYNLEK